MRLKVKIQLSTAAAVKEKTKEATVNAAGDAAGDEAGDAAFTPNTVDPTLNV